MFCRMCGVEIPKDSKFCPECGVKVEKFARSGVETTLEDQSVGILANSKLEPAQNIKHDTEDKTQKTLEDAVEKNFDFKYRIYRYISPKQISSIGGCAVIGFIIDMPAWYMTIAAMIICTIAYNLIKEAKDGKDYIKLTIVVICAVIGFIVCSVLRGGIIRENEARDRIKYSTPARISEPDLYVNDLIDISTDETRKKGEQHYFIPSTLKAENKNLYTFWVRVNPASKKTTDIRFIKVMCQTKSHEVAIREYKWYNKQGDPCHEGGSPLEWKKFGKESPYYNASKYINNME